MADKTLMNKNALANLKADLRNYRNVLPVFEMKEQQLKEVVRSVESSIRVLNKEIENTKDQIQNWVGVMAEEVSDFSDSVKVDEVVTEKLEIAGVVVDSFVKIDFKSSELDFFNTPIWVDAAIEVIQDQKTRRTMLAIARKKHEKLQEELDEARRMKNALKEVFIPQAVVQIRKIEIYLGDVERLAIGCAKLVKKKKQQKSANHDR